jgi:hypothetical protein
MVRGLVLFRHKLTCGSTGVALRATVPNERIYLSTNDRPDILTL